MPGRLIAFGDGGAFRGVEHFTTRKAYIKPAYSRVTWTLTGRFANGLMSGNWRVTMRVFHVKRHKQRIDTCTARIPFKGALV